MKKTSLVLLILLFASCKKNDNQDFNVDTRVQVIIVDDEDNDLLDKSTNRFINLDNITFTVSGDNDKNEGNPPFYPYFTIKDFVSPEYVQNIQWSEELQKNYLSVFLDHTFSNTSTIINWGQDFLPDTLRADIIFNKTRMEVKYSSLYLNDKLVQTKNTKGRGYVKIKKRVSRDGK